MALSLDWCSISELCIVSGDIPQDVADKLLKYHIIPMTPTRGMMGAPLTASQKSGYRPEWYEKNRGRSGLSQHCFKDRGGVIGKGAVDWTTQDLGDLEKLYSYMCQFTPYTRICIYRKNGFIHADYKNDIKDRWAYTCASPTSNWVRVKQLPNI